MILTQLAAAVGTVGTIVPSSDTRVLSGVRLANQQQVVLLFNGNLVEKLPLVVLGWFLHDTLLEIVEHFALRQIRCVLIGIALCLRWVIHMLMDERKPTLRAILEFL